MKALIVTGGRTDPEFAGQLLQKEEFELKIASDSGMHYFYQAGILPDLLVGDFDSADPQILDYYEKHDQVEICRLNPIKDDTDTEHAIHEAIARGADSITVLGATGSRLDHMMGNLCLLGIGLEQGVTVCMQDPHNRIRMINRPLRIRKSEQFGRFVSLVPFAGPVTGLTLTGMKYLVEDFTLDCFKARGISNEIEAEEAEIRFRSGYLLVMESRD